MTPAVCGEEDEHSDDGAAAVERQIYADIGAACSAISMFDVRRKIRIIDGYDAPSKKTVNQVRQASRLHHRLVHEAASPQLGSGELHADAVQQDCPCALMLVWEAFKPRHQVRY